MTRRRSCLARLPVDRGGAMPDNPGVLAFRTSEAGLPSDEDGPAQKPAATWDYFRNNVHRIASPT
jgi:hypothetical protein